MNPNVNASFALLGRLKDLGVTNCVVSPGSRNTPLAYVANILFDTISVIDERDAGFFALGISQASGTAPIVITTSGSAPAHLLPSVCEAYNSNLGMIVISADRPLELRKVGAPQTVNQVNLFGSHARYSFDTILASEVTDNKYWTDIADDIYGTVNLVGDIRGPAHLNIAFNDWLTPDGDEKYKSFDSLRSLQMTGDVVLSEAEGSFNSLDLLKMLENATNGIITMGRNSFVDTSKVLELSHTLNWPILADITSGGRSMPEAISNYDTIARSSEIDNIFPEYILQFGEALGSKAWNQKIILKKTKVFAIKCFDDGRDPYSYITNSLILENPNFLLDSLIENVDKQSNEYKKGFKELSLKCNDLIVDLLDNEISSEPKIFKDLHSVFSSHHGDYNILLGNSMPIRYAEWLWNGITPNIDIYCNRGANGIDGAISTSTGIGYASSSQTIGIFGDVTFTHDIGFLPHCVKLANEYGINFIFVVIDNDGGAIFSHLDQGNNSPLKESYTKLIQTPTEIDFEKVSEAFGARTGSSLDEFKFALSNNQPGVDVIVLKAEHLSGRTFMSLLQSKVTNI